MLFSVKNKTYKCLLGGVCSLLLFVGAGQSVGAQDNTVLSDEGALGQGDVPEITLVPPVSPAEQESVLGDYPTGEPTLEDMSLRVKLNAPSLDPSQITSLFFTGRDHALLVEARKGFLTRTPGEGELTAETALVMGPREVSLGGIVYLSSNDWVVWVNGKRITPKAIPSEILDIKVAKKYIKLQWFDEYTNQIFPIKLRANQRFNIDSRIFLPG